MNEVCNWAARAAQDVLHYPGLARSARVWRPWTASEKIVSERGDGSRSPTGCHGRSVDVETDLTHPQISQISNGGPSPVVAFCVIC